ncbi:Uncharacterized protein dnm_023450 [Desulfonema magnum]|uniref:Uncharacterized protein n=1 Tax=Desulfonema magnum TaxID=45655 RepID=A0A975GMY9_9BACT|nr:Uncharacterized protein dnm_023450 [Desulfonema magnum]
MAGGAGGCGGRAFSPQGFCIRRVIQSFSYMKSMWGAVREPWDRNRAGPPGIKPGGFSALRESYDTLFDGKKCDIAPENACILNNFIGFPITTPMYPPMQYR